MAPSRPEPAHETARPSGWRQLADARAAASFGAIEVLSIPLFIFWGRHWWFWADDWDFLATRTGWNAKDVFRGHYQHWTTLPVLAYRALWFVFGLHSYVPYQLLVIVAHLVAAALLRLVMRRAGVRPWIATLTALVFVFFGSGAENILIAFQVTFVGSLVFGLTQLLLADHDGPLDHRDWLGVLAGLAGLMCSGVALAMTIIVGLAMLLRRGWRIALVHTAPLAAAYLIWSSFSPKGRSAGAYRADSPLQVIKFVAIGIGSAFGRLAQIPGLGFVFAAMMVVGLILVFRAEGPGALRGRLAVPIALLVGALVFLVVTGLARSGQSGPLANAIGTGPARARQSRYVYLIAAMALPALALAVDAVVRGRRRLAIPVVALLVVGVPGNIRELATFTNRSSEGRQAFRTAVLEAPRLPLARELPRSSQPAPPRTFAGLTLGWLLDSLPSGRIPAPRGLTSAEIATLTLHLALRPGKVPLSLGCRRFTKPVTVVLGNLQRITLESGSSTIEYLPTAGDSSPPELFLPSTFKSFVDGSLRLRIEPGGGAPIVLCTPAKPIAAP
ncbi:MAG: hypothetical protein QOG50_2727 [Actinomycetota bacterium]|nr:hypothetical protein [Actinomycetota bacterium]